MSDIATGEESTCIHCRQRILAVIDGSSGCVDWGAEDRRHPADPVWFDFGCGEHPLTGEDGTHGHDPGPGHTPLGFRILIDSKSYWQRIEIQKAAQLLAQKGP